MTAFPLVIDIETMERPDLQPALRQSIVERAAKWERDADTELATSPFTAMVVAIGMLRVGATPEQDIARVILAAPAPDASVDPVTGVLWAGDEAGALAAFWSRAENQALAPLVTFNGRAFDVPFLDVRSRVQGITPTRSWADAYRYGDRDPLQAHLDIFDVLTARGATRWYPSLELACSAFGIESPKGEMSGADVGAAWRSGRFADVLAYLLRDLKATAALARRTVV